MPSVVVGPTLLTKARADYNFGTNALMINLLIGESYLAPLIASTVSIHDVAQLHVKALSPTVPAGRYLVAGQGTRWADAIEKLKRTFLVKSGRRSQRKGKHQIWWPI